MFTRGASPAASLLPEASHSIVRMIVDIAIVFITATARRILGRNNPRHNGRIDSAV